MLQMTREELEKKYYSMTNDELCKELGVSKVTLISYIKRAGIKQKGKGMRKKVEIV